MIWIFEVCCNFGFVLNRGTIYFVAKRTRATTPRVTAKRAQGHAGQPRRHEAHWPGSKGDYARELAAARQSAAIAGDVAQAKTRERALSTRKTFAHRLGLAPLVSGRRSVVYFAGNHGDGGGGTAMQTETVAKLRATRKRGKWSDGFASSPRRRWR